MPNRFLASSLAVGVFVAVVAAPSSALGNAEKSGGWSSLHSSWASMISAGDSHLANAHYARALDYYEESQRLAPYSHVPFLRSASAFYQWGEAIEGRRGDLWPLAMKNADKARRLDPLSAEASFLSAIIRYRMGDFAGAVDIYREMEKLRQGDINLYLDLAIAAYRSGDRSLAANALARAEAIDPASERLHSVAKILLSGK